MKTLIHAQLLNITTVLGVVLCVADLLRAEEIIITNFLGFSESQSNMEIVDGRMYPYWQAFTNGKDGDYYGFNFPNEEEFIEATLKRQIMVSGGDTEIFNSAVKHSNGFMGEALSFSNIAQEFFLPLSSAFITNATNYSGNFSLELMVRPRVMAGEMQFYTVRSYVHKLKEKGNSEGLVLGASGGKPYLQFENFFHFRDNTFSYRLQGSQALKLGQWTHLKATFDREEGLLQFWENGEVVDFTYTTKTGRKSETVFLPGMLSELPTLVELGKAFVGEIDEVNIAALAETPSPINQVKPLFANEISFASTFSSKVFRIEPYSKITSVELLDSQLEEKDVFIDVCYSKKYFVTFLKSSISVNERNKKCQLLSFGQTLQQEDEALYYQFNLIVKRSDRKKIVGFKGFRINYEVDKPPFAPKLTRAEALSDGTFLLVWQRSGDEDIKGYTIYYSQMPFSSLDGREKKMEISLQQLESVNNTREMNLLYHYTFLRPQTKEVLNTSEINIPNKNGNSENIVGNIGEQGMYYFAIRSYDRMEEDQVGNKTKRFSALSNIVSSYMRF